jgi:hypothetical protein
MESINNAYTRLPFITTRKLTIDGALADLNHICAIGNGKG